MLSPPPHSLLLTMGCWLNSTWPVTGKGWCELRAFLAWPSCFGQAFWIWVFGFQNLGLWERQPWTTTTQIFWTSSFLVGLPEFESLGYSWDHWNVVGPMRTGANFGSSAAHGLLESQRCCFVEKRECFTALCHRCPCRELLSMKMARTFAGSRASKWHLCWFMGPTDRLTMLWDRYINSAACLQMMLMLTPGPKFYIWGGGSYLVPDRHILILVAFLWL